MTEGGVGVKYSLRNHQCKQAGDWKTEGRKCCEEVFVFISAVFGQMTKFTVYLFFLKSAQCINVNHVKVNWQEFYFLFIRFCFVLLSFPCYPVAFLLSDSFYSPQSIFHTLKQLLAATNTKHMNKATMAQYFNMSTNSTKCINCMYCIF